MCAFKPFRNDPSRAQLTVARKISIIHVAYTITISSLSLSLPFSLPLFLFSSIGRFIRLRNGKGCVELRMELLSLNFIIVIFSIEFIELLLLLLFKYIDCVKKRKYSKFNFSILWIWSWDKIIFSLTRFLHEQYCIEGISWWMGKDLNEAWLN